MRRVTIEALVITFKIMKTGIQLILEERKRQKADENYSHEHDDTHEKGEIAKAAATYCLTEEQKNLQIIGPGTYIGIVNKMWPFDLRAYKPTPDDRVRELTKAGALIAAEIDRLRRQK